MVWGRGGSGRKSFNNLLLKMKNQMGQNQRNFFKKSVPKTGGIWIGMKVHEAFIF
jgi:hypothetical protein